MTRRPNNTFCAGLPGQNPDKHPQNAAFLRTAPDMTIGGATR